MLGNVRAGLADNDSQFAFVVHFGSYVFVKINGIVRTDKRCSGFREEHRIFRLFYRCDLIELGNVFTIVFTDTQDIVNRVGQGSQNMNRI